MFSDICFLLAVGCKGCGNIFRRNGNLFAEQKQHDIVFRQRAFWPEANACDCVHADRLQIQLHIGFDGFLHHSRFDAAEKIVLRHVLRLARKFDVRVFRRQWKRCV